MDPEKMKVVDLREELKSRGLDSKGNKAQLVRRLKTALNQPDADASFSHLDTSDSLEESVTEQEGSAMHTDDDGPGGDLVKDAPSPEPVAEQQNGEHVEPMLDEPAALDKCAGFEADASVEDHVVAESGDVKDDVGDVKDEGGDVKDEGGDVKDEVGDVKDEGGDVKDECADVKDECADVKDEGGDVKDECADVKDEGGDVKDKCEDVKEEGGATVESEGDEAMEQNEANDVSKAEVAGAKVTDDVSGDDHKVVDEVGQGDHGQKRKHNESVFNRRSYHDDREEDRTTEDDYSWLESTTFQIDRFNSDLNLVVESGFKAKPFSHYGFAYMWAGTRAMFGVTGGKVAFEVKVTEHANVSHLKSDEPNPHVLRVGWSPDSATLQLGEEPLSYGYGGTAKKSVNCKFSDYGKEFGKGDVITAYLDLDSEVVNISFSFNGEDQGVCFELQPEERESLGEKALFPTVLTKNSMFELNFGLKEEPWFPLKEGYIFMEEVPAESRVRGSVPAEKKEDCELLMMVGLPGCGKTTWAEKHVAANPEKKYNVLGTNNIIDRMKVMGLPRKSNYSGRWDVLIDLSTKCLNKLFFTGARRRRNYILDQTNVYASARRRKMVPFEGFRRRAIVIVPTDEEFKRRCEERTDNEGKEIPESAVLEMKANFTLPDDGTSYIDDVEFVELQKDEATELTKKYSEEATALLPPPEKRWRGGNDRSYGGHSGGEWQQRGRGRGGPRGGNAGFNRGGGYNNRGGGGGYNNRGGGGGYNSRGASGGGGYNSRGASGGGGYNSRGASGGGGYNNRGASGGGGYNNRGGGGYNQNRNNRGSWDNQVSRGRGGYSNQSGSWANKPSPWGNQSGDSSSGWGNQSLDNQGWSGGGRGSSSSSSSTLQQYGASSWNNTDQQSSGYGNQQGWGQGNWGQQQQQQYWGGQQGGYGNWYGSGY